MWFLFFSFVFLFFFFFFTPPCQSTPNLELEMSLKSEASSVELHRYILEELSSLTKMLLPVLSLAQAQQTSCSFWT